MTGLSAEEAEASEDRVSKVAFLEDDLHPALATIKRRVEHMTLLTTEVSDLLQIANYGLAGHYNPHFDFFKVQVKSRLMTSKDAVPSLFVQIRIT